ncbi:MAG: AbrB/MazE/SpoVT family DNA-binding domain-containing protein [Candidatus Atribacteria bacterium]|nr:AbrB/MazE/SpoVT family DNA-binding domain-containing protein [Candidatus Atribacteria bacterium]
MTTTIVSAKGQIVIPSKLRRKYNIKKGVKLYIEERDGELVLKAVTSEYIQKISGILETKGKLSKLLLKERSEDEEREI